jgi:hypothetical protein
MRLEGMTMTTGPTPARMKQINEAFKSRDVDRIMSFFAADCTRPKAKRGTADYAKKR